MKRKIDFVAFLSRLSDRLRCLWKVLKQSPPWRTFLSFAPLALLTSLLLLGIWFNVSPLLRGPAPWPPDWRWEYRTEVNTRGMGLIIICMTGLIGLVAATGLSSAQRRPRRAGILLLAGATVFGCALQYSLLEAEDAPSGADLIVTRTISPVFTSHYNVAISPVSRDVGKFLNSYTELLPHFPLHTKTHPPGAVLFYRAVLAVCESTDWLTRGLVSLSRDLNVNLKPFDLPRQAPWVATALLGPLLIMVMASATCWPIAALAGRLGLSPMAAVRVGVLWACLPGPLLMVPELDQLLAFPVVLFALLLLISTSEKYNMFYTYLFALLAGFVGGAAYFVSYGAAFFLAFTSFLVAACVSDNWRRLRCVGTVIIVACVGAVAINLLPVLAGHNPLQALLTSLKLHGQLFTEQRSYTTWLLFNLWDFIVFLGFPLAVLMVVRVLPAVLRVLRGQWKNLRVPALRLQLASFLGLFLLDATGVVRGEVGRIWLPLMPFFLISALLHPSESSDYPRQEGHNDYRVATKPTVLDTIAIALLLLSCAWVLRLKWHLP